MRRLALGLGFGVAFLSGAIPASGSMERSPFPQARPDDGAALMVQTSARGPAVPRIQSSPRPPARPAALIEERPAMTGNDDFDRWLSGFRSRALAEGISPATFDRAFADVTRRDDVIRRDGAQAEFVRPVWEYLDITVSEARIFDGRRALREHDALLDRIEAHYGVDREVIVAIWGLESAYGSLRGDTPIIDALATLAHDGRRARFFESQLIGALQIIEAGDVDAAHMLGSWAGAMGHTQFIPTSYLAYAVDFDGDGQRDIWSDDPTDSLASTAAYLSGHGWNEGQPWAVEVRLPGGFDLRQAGNRRALEAWRAMGVDPVRGAELPDGGLATLKFPAGAQGPALLAFENFGVIKRYNSSDSYVIAVGHLADRLRGGGSFVSDWPRDDRPLTRSEREELQRLLVARGHDTGGIDGRVGPATVAAVRRWQSTHGLPADGYVSLNMLERLRRQ